MGLFSKLFGKKEEESDPMPSDYVIASKIATIIEHALTDPSMGFKDLLEPNCAVVLDTKGGVSLRWLSQDKPQLFKDIVGYALVARLPNFSSFAKDCLEMAKMQDEQTMELWFQSMGRIEVDQIATQALREMKINAAKAEQARG